MSLRTLARVLSILFLLAAMLQAQTPAKKLANVKTLAYSSNGRWLVSVRSNGNVTVWDRKNYRSEHAWSDATGPVAFNPGDNLLAVGFKGNAIELFAVPSWKEVRTLTADALNLAFSPDGRQLATVSSSGKGLLFDVATGTLLNTLSGADQSLAFSPNGRWLVTGRNFSPVNDDGIEVWDPSSGKSVHSAPGAQGAWPSAIAFTPDGHWLITLQMAGETKVYDTKDWKPVRTITPDGLPKCMVVSPDNHWLATGNEMGVSLYEISSGKRLRRLTAEKENEATSLALTNDGKQLASGNADGSITLWDPATGKVVKTLAP